jgi:uncharacterized membrane protein YfcA
MTPLLALILFGAGVVAGFINVVAGGGSLITLPTLIFLGLSATEANGTNRVALVGQNLMAMIRFYRGGFRDLRLGLELGLPAVVGAVIGAKVAVSISDDLFRNILSGVMLLVMVGILAKRKPATQDPPQEESLRHRKIQPLLFLVIGAYGGFIQAGVGYLVIFALSAVGGLSLVRTNSLKVIVVGLYMLPSLVVFLLGGKVVWIPGLVLTAGNSLGGWLGSTFSVKKGDRWIKGVLALAVSVMAAKLLGLF